MSVRASFIGLVVLSLGLTCSAQFDPSINSSRSAMLPNSGHHEVLSSVSGSVVALNGKALSDVRVDLRDSNGTTVAYGYTNSAGQFALAEVPTGMYQIVAVKGTNSAEERLTVMAGQTPVMLRLSTGDDTASDGSSTVSVASLRVPDKARKAYEKAQEALNKNKLEDARKYSEKALEAYPQYANALTLRGILEMNDGAVDKAMDDFDHAVKADPSYGLAYTTMGAAYNQQGRYKDAQRVLQRAIAIQPDSWQNYFEMAKSSLGDANYKDALQYVGKASVISQEYPPLHLVKAHALLGLKQYPDAIGELELYLNREPSGAAADAARKVLSNAKAFVTSAQK